MNYPHQYSTPAIEGVVAQASAHPLWGGDVPYVVEAALACTSLQNTEQAAVALLLKLAMCRAEHHNLSSLKPRKSSAQKFEKCQN